MEAMIKEKAGQGLPNNTMWQSKETWDQWCKHCKAMTKYTSNNCFSHEANKDKCPQWPIKKMENKGKQTKQTKERWGMG